MYNAKTKELVFTSGLGIVFFLVPFGLSVSVIPKWIFWGLSAVCVLVIFHICVPSITRRFGITRTIALDIAIMCLLLYFAGPTIYSQWKVEKSNATSGELVAQGAKVLYASSPLFIRGGDGQSRIQFTSPINAGIFVSPTGATYSQNFTLENDNGTILISAIILDRNHNLLATIEKNHWRIWKNQSADYNYDDDSLEIKDLRGHVVFLVRLLPEEVWLQWEWDSTDTQIGGITESGKYSQEKGITPMFKYPSDEHWGELSENYRR